MNATPKMAEDHPLTSRRARFSWMLYDWAAQPYHTLIITFIFAPYFVDYVATDPATGQAIWGYTLTIGALLVAAMAPVLGAVADTSGQRKPWIGFFSLFAIVGCWGLWWATPDGTASMFWVLTAFVVATIGIEMTTIFTNAMMPALVSRRELGKLSGSGWALGYIGGLIALVLVLLFMVADPEDGTTLIGLTPWFGLDPHQHEGDRAAGPLSALWFLLFIIPLFLFTPDHGIANARFSVRQGLARLARTVQRLPRRRSFSSFLLASLLFRDGLNALYAFGGIYAKGVLGLSIIQIGIFGIIAAVAGAIGAFVGGRLDARFGPRPVMIVACLFLIVSCALVISTTTDVALFIVPLVPGSAVPLIVLYIAGSIIGAAGGTLQASARTLLMDQVRPQQATEAFGLYALTGRATAFMGPFLVAIVTDVTRSQRIGITPIIVLLALGALGLIWVRQYGDDDA